MAPSARTKAEQHLIGSTPHHSSKGVALLMQRYMEDSQSAHGIVKDSIKFSVQVITRLDYVCALRLTLKSYAFATR